MLTRALRLGPPILLLACALGCKSEPEVISLVALFDTAEKTSSLPNLDESVRPMECQIAGEQRSSIYAHPTSSVSYQLELPKKAVLRFAIALAQDVWDKEGDGVEFVVWADDGSGRKKLFSSYIDPKHDHQARRWNDHEVDLSAYGGRKVTLTLETNPGPSDNSAYDWAVWGDPVIVER